MTRKSHWTHWTTFISTGKNPTRKNGVCHLYRYIYIDTIQQYNNTNNTTQTTQQLVDRCI